MLMQKQELNGQFLELWQDILQSSEIKEKEDFFDLGGTSLSLIELLTQTRKRFSVNLNIGDFEHGLTLEIYTDLMNKALN